MSSSIPKRAAGYILANCDLSPINQDFESYPSNRLTNDGYALVSSVSVKRKVRDIILDKGPTWQAIKKQFDDIDDERFQIAEDPARNLSEMFKFVQKNGMNDFLNKYWDTRVFGTMVLEENKTKKGETNQGHLENKQDIIRTGAVVVSWGISIAPVESLQFTQSRRAKTQEDKSRGVAPMAKGFLRHAVVGIPFFVNPNSASKSCCTQQDVEVFKRILPHIYSFSRSEARPNIEVLHCWYWEYETILANHELSIIRSLKPRKILNPNEPSIDLSEYYIPTFDDVDSSWWKNVSSKCDLID